MGNRSIKLRKTRRKNTLKIADYSSIVMLCATWIYIAKNDYKIFAAFAVVSIVGNVMGIVLEAGRDLKNVEETKD